MSNQDMTKENKMGTMPMGKLLLNMGLPIMLSMLVQALYNIVDSIFVAQICEDALTAVSLAFPMQNLMIGVGTGFGVGTNALLSRALGEKKFDKANKTALNGILLAVLSYILFLVLGLLMARRLFIIQDATPEIVDFGESYLFYITTFSLGLFMQVTFEKLLQSTGRTVLSMITQGTGAILNIILDPVLIFGLAGFPKLGIAGAAIATCIGQTVAGVMALIFNIYFNKDIDLSLKGFKPDANIIKNILFIGIPSVVMIAIGSIMTFCVNKILIVFTSTAVAVFGVYFKLQSFAFMPIFGLNNGMIPIVGYNYGAKKYDRMLSCRKLAIVYAEIIMICCLIVFELVPDKLLMMFKASDHMLSIGVPALRIIALHFLLAGFSVISSSFFQALGHSIYSTIISFVRQIVFLIPFAYFISLLNNVNLVWIAWPIAELASVALCFLFQRKIQKNILVK